MKTAIITGLSGQDGFYLSRVLMAKDYQIVGTTHEPKKIIKKSDFNKAKQVQLVQWDLLDQEQLINLVKSYQPAEIYHLAALSSGSTMFENPVLMAQINGLSVIKILEAIRLHSPDTRFCQASSSEIFGSTSISPQAESTPPMPTNPYGASKLYGDNMIRIYREKYGIFACSAILYNHESPRRPLHFVTRKITNTAAKIKLGLATNLALGNLEAIRDWSFAGDAMSAMWFMVQQNTASDYVVSSGIRHTVRQFCEVAFSYLGLDYLQYVVEDPQFYRPLESVARVGDSQKLRKIGWSSQCSFTELVHSMVDEDMKILSMTL